MHIFFNPQWNVDYLLPSGAIIIRNEVTMKRKHTVCHLSSPFIYYYY